MGAGLFSGDPTGVPAGVPCNPDCWSEESKRSVAYEFSRAAYRDKAYKCWRCDAPDIFTAAEQKHAFEVRKVNISQQRVLCRHCHREKVQLDREAEDCRERWAAERPSLCRNLEFLRRWLAVLEALPSYAAPRDHANITMLRRLVSRDESPERGETCHP